MSISAPRSARSPRRRAERERSKGSTVVARAKILHAYGSDSVGIVFQTGEKCSKTTDGSAGSLTRRVSV